MALSSLIDGAVAVVPAAIVGMVAYGMRGEGPTPQGLGIERFFEAIALAPSTWMSFLVVALVAHVAHHVVVVPKLGGTIGQKALGLGLLRMDGGRASVKDAGVRACASVVGSLLFMVGALWGWLLHPLTRGAGDLAANTIVVDRRDVP